MDLGTLHNRVVMVDIVYRGSKFSKWIFVPIYICVSRYQQHNIECMKSISMGSLIREQTKYITDMIVNTYMNYQAGPLQLQNYTQHNGM